MNEQARSPCSRVPDRGTIISRSMNDDPKENPMVNAFLTTLALSVRFLTWIRAERQALMPIAGFVMTIIVFSGGVVHLTLGGDELRQRAWECQDEIGDRSQEGWEFCMDLLTKPAPSEDGC